MRNHEEFMAEIYSRKEEYIKEKKRKAKRTVAFVAPLAIVLVAYSALILPAMMPAEMANPSDGAAETEPETGSEAEATQGEVETTLLTPSHSDKQENAQVTDRIAVIAYGEQKTTCDKAKIDNILLIISDVTAVQEMATELITENATALQNSPAKPEAYTPETRIEISAGGREFEYTLQGNILTDLGTGVSYNLTDEQLKNLTQAIKF